MLLNNLARIIPVLKKYWGDTYDVIPRSKEHAKDAEIVNRSFLGWLSWQRTRNHPLFAFLYYNDAHSPYEVPDRPTPAFGLRPISHVDRLRSWRAFRKLPHPAAPPRNAGCGCSDQSGPCGMNPSAHRACGI